MHNAIEFHVSPPTPLTFGKRQRLPQGRLIQIEAGMALLRLGSDELLLAGGEIFWLPADCLASFTPLHGCAWRDVRLSVRLPQRDLSGWIAPTPLLTALLSSLADWTDDRQWQGPFGDRLRVLADELARQPLCQAPHPTPLQQAWAQIKEGVLADTDANLQPLIAQWQLVRADRLLKGGQPMSQVLARVGYPDEASWQAALAFWCR